MAGEDLNVKLTITGRNNFGPAAKGVVRDTKKMGRSFAQLSKQERVQAVLRQEHSRRLRQQTRQELGLVKQKRLAFKNMSREQQVAFVREREMNRQRMAALRQQVRGEMGIGQKRTAGGSMFLGANAAQIGSAMNQISSSVGRVNRAVIGGSIQAFGSFEDAMADVAAKGGDTAEMLKEQSDLARELGISTRFSATQAAGGFAFLAQAGFSAEDRLKALPPILDLAAASSTELERTADITSNIMTGFGIAASDSARIADVLTNSVNKSNTNLDQLGEAMANVAPIARQMNVSLEETAALVGILSDAGIQGSKAGVSTRAILTRLAAPNSKVRAGLKNAGISESFVAQNISDPQKILARIAKSLEGKTEAEQAAILKDIGGQRQVAALSALVKGVEEGAFAKKLGENIESAGAAAEGASKKMDTMNASLERIQNAGQELGIVFGDILKDDVNALADSVENRVLPAVKGWLEANPGLARGIAAGSLGLQGFTRVSGGFFNAMAGANGLIGVMKSAGFEAATLSKGINGIGWAGAAAGAFTFGFALGTYIDSQLQLSDKLSKKAAELFGITQAGAEGQVVEKRGLKGVATETEAGRGQKVDLLARARTRLGQAEVQLAKQERQDAIRTAGLSRLFGPKLDSDTTAQARRNVQAELKEVARLEALADGTKRAVKEGLAESTINVNLREDAGRSG